MSYKLRITLLTIALVAAGTANAQLYRWIDADGRTIVSDTPPPPEFKHQTIRKAVPGKTETDGKEKPADGQLKPGGQESSNCALARQNLQAIESGRPLTMTNAKGEIVPMDSAARAEELTKVREILRNCKT